MNTYYIKVHGEVDEPTLNAKSPLQMTMRQADADATIFTAYTDQSGLIGLLRHLHGQGFVLLAVYCDANETTFRMEDPNDD